MVLKKQVHAVRVILSALIKRQCAKEPGCKVSGLTGLKLMGKLAIRKTLWPAWAMLFAGLLLTTLASLQVKQHIEQEAVAQFSFTCDQVAVEIQDRLSAYALLLRSGSGLFASQAQINRQTWQAYADTLEMANSISGMQAMSFASIVSQDKLAAHISQIRAEGFPDYTVSPAGKRALYAPVIYISPFSARNQRAFGYDSFAEPVRRVAMEQARDSGEATLTGKLMLQQENGVDVQAGVIMFVPVYQTGVPKATVENRRQSVIGWLAGVYRMNDLMAGLLHNLSRYEIVDLQIYDGLKTAPATLLFDGKTPHQQDKYSLFYQSRILNFNGHNWTLVFDQAASPLNINYFVLWATLFGGIVLSGLLFGLLRSVITTRGEAIKIADKLTAEIRYNEALLLESEYRLKFAVDGAGDGVWDWNMLNNAMQFSSLYMSMLGYTEYELPHHADTWLASVHPDDMGRVQQNLSDYLAGSIPGYRIELRLRCKDGSYKWILCRGKVAGYDHQGKPVRMVGIHSDISGHKRVEEQLSDSLAFNITILDQSPSGIAVYQAGGACVMSNQAYAKMVGTSVDEILKQNFRNIPSWQQNGLLDFAGQALATREVIRTEVEEITSFGKDVVLECVFSFLEITEKPHLLLITNDISARVLAEKKISESMCQLEKKELAKTRFLAAAGHDLRQPLAAANMFIYALRYSGLNPEQNELIMSLTRSMSTFKELLDTLLQVSRLDSNVIKPEYTMINVAELFIWVEQNFSAIANEKKLKLRLYFPLTETLMIKSDIGLIKSVLINLVSNALKFTHKGGILLSARRRGGNILFQVWDTGIGIADEKRELIFDEFFQIANPQRDRASGQGLGLSIVKRTLALLGAEACCRSKLGKGTVFEFFLPCIEAGPLQSANPLQAIQIEGSLPDGEFARASKFVIVEDDLLVAQATIAWLAVMGAHVTSFQSAEEALQHADTEHTDYYIVDYMLSGKLNGLQFLNLLSQKSKRRIKAVLVTGDTSGNFMHEAANFNWPVHYKPVNATVLLDSLKAQEGS